MDLNITNPCPAGSPEHSAYQCAYGLVTAHPRRSYKALCGRVLGHMLQELPWIHSRLAIAQEVNRCINEQSLVELGTFYIDHFFGACE
jgi:hypothetical protein